MPVVGYLLRARLRQRWPALLGLALLAGVATGAVVAGASGARRTETAYDRLLVASNAGQVLVSTEEGGGYEAVSELDGVSSVARLVAFELYPVGIHRGTDVLTKASVDGTFGYEVDRPNMVSGRMPRPARDDEILVNPAFTETFGLAAGDRVTLAAQDFADYVRELPPDPDTPVIDVTITGVGVTAIEVVPTTDLDGLPGILVPPALLERLLAAGAPEAFDGAMVTIDGSRDAASVMGAIGDALGFESTFLLDAARTQATVERAIGPQATALWIFTATLLLVAALVVGQAAARQAGAGAADDLSLAALGVRRLQLVRVAALEGAIVGATAALLAAAVAAAASSRFPVGRARLAEPEPGLALHLGLLAVGTVGIIALISAASAVVAFVAARPGPAGLRARRPSTAAGAAAAVGAGPRVVLGLRRAFETGGGAATVPVRSGLVGAVVAVGAVMAAATFAASLDTLVRDPARYGQTWTTSVDAQFAPVPVTGLVDRYGADPEVAGMAGISYGELDIEGVPVSTIAYEVLTGELDLTVLEGRRPAAVGEVALGSLTLRALGASVGDDVTVLTEEGPSLWRVVGRVVFPQLSQGSFSSLGLGSGAVVPAAAVPSPHTLDDVAEAIAAGYILGDWEATDFIFDDRSYNAVLLRATDGAEADLTARFAQDLGDTTGGSNGFGVKVLQRPAAISTYADVRGTPVVLAILLAGLAAALVAHVLVTSVRLRRRELATCRAIGMRGVDVASVVRWQATALAVVAVLLGAPLGIALGRTAWSVFADGVGVPAAPTVPWIWLGIATAGTILVANVAGALPARRAARLPAAVALRVE